jgi:uncharacterized protein HemX
MGRGRASLTVAILVVALLLPAADALAQGSSATPVLPGQSSNAITPFTPQGPTPTQTAPPTVTPAPTSTTASGLTGTGAIAIAIGAVLVLGGISFFIWRDARKRAPVRQHAPAEVGTGPRQRPQKNRKLSPAERRRRKRGKAR